MNRTMKVEDTKVLEKTTIISNVTSFVAAIIAAAIVGFAFYFQTNFTLESHENALDKLEKKSENIQSKVSEIEVYKGVSSSEIKNIEKKVDRIELKIDELLLIIKQ